MYMTFRQTSYEKKSVLVMNFVKLLLEQDLARNIFFPSSFLRRNLVTNLIIV